MLNKSAFLIICLALSFIISGAVAQDDLHPVITAENAAQVELLAQMGVDRVYDLDWSADGEHLAVFSQNQLAVYNPDDLDTPNILDYNPCGESVYPCRGTVRFTDDAETLLVGSGYYITTYTVPAFTPLATYETEMDTSVLYYSEAYDLLVHGGGPPNNVTIAIRDFDAKAAHDNPQQIYLFGDADLRGVMFEEGPASGIALSPDGRTLAVANGLFMVSQLRGYFGLSTTYAYDLQGLFDELDDHNVPTTYALSDDEDPFQIPLEGDSSGLTKVAFSPDGTLLIGAGTDGGVRLWSMSDGALLKALDAHYSTIWDMAFSPDGATLATAGGDGAIHLWDVATWEKRRTISGLGMAITSLTFSPDGSRMAVGGWDGSLWIVDAAVGEIVESRPTQQFLAWTIAFNADGTRFVLSNDGGEVVLFDVVDEPPFIVQKRVFRAHQGPVYAVTFHPDGQHLASGGSDGMIYVWDIDSGEVVQTAETEPHSAVYGLTYNPDGTVLYCGTLQGKNEVRTYDTVTWCSTTHDETGQAVYSLAFSPDGAYFAYGDTEVESPARFYSVTLDTGRGWSDSYHSSRSKLTFSMDGSVLLNGGTQQMTYVWHMDNLAAGPLRFEDGLMALSPDGSLVAGRELAIYDSRTGEQLLPLGDSAPPMSIERYYASLPRDAVFSPDGRLIVTASTEGFLRFWGLPTD